MKILEKVIQSNLPPTRQDVVWIDTSDVQYPVVKLYVNGEWKIASSESEEIQELQEEINAIIEELAGEGGTIEDLSDVREGAELGKTSIQSPEVEGNPGQILQLDEEGKPEWVDAAEVGATYDSSVSDESTNAIQNKTIKKYVDDTAATKANVDGYYATMGVGTADNLASHGSVPAEYTFRTSGGSVDIGTGSAQITKLKGKTLVWNQVCTKATAGTTVVKGVTFTIADDGRITINGTADEDIKGSDISITNYINIINGHKYAVYAVGKGPHTIVSIKANMWGGALALDYVDKYSIVTATDTRSNERYGVSIRQGTQVNVSFYLCLFDLTRMFGEGNEPSSVVEFIALYPGNYGYNAGKLKNNDALAVVTTGFNQWDEEWEVGSISNDTGLPIADLSGRIRAKNHINVFPSTNYNSNSKIASVFYYDINHNFISSWSLYEHGDVFTTPQNCYYIKFITYTVQGGTYNHDICINLSWSGYRNGEYEPYWKSTLQLNLNALACHDEDNNAVVVNGLDGVGSSHDEGVVENVMLTKIIKRFAEIDLGDLTWTYDSYYNAYYAAVSGKANGETNIICGNYETVANAGELTNKSITGYYNTNIVYIKNTAFSGYTDEQVAEALSGSKLRYELSTPLILTLDTPIPVSYRVDDFGTEERTSPVDADGAQSAPIVYDVQYAMNAVDTLRNLPKNYISKDSMDNILTALKTAGIIADYTLTFDSETREYECVITAPTPGE
jgi:hypothetical protein